MWALHQHPPHLIQIQKEGKQKPRKGKQQKKEMKGSQGIDIVFLQFIGSQEKDKCQDHHCCCHLFSLSCIIFTLVCCHDYSHHHHHHHYRHHHHWATTINLSYILIHHVQSNVLIFCFFYFLYWLFNSQKLYFQEIWITREDFETARCSTTKSCLILSPCQKVRFFLCLFPCFYANLKLFKIIKMPLSCKWVTCSADII